MARITPVDPAAADPSLAPLFSDFIRERGAVPNMFRTLAHAPDLVKTFFAHFRAVLAEGAVSTRLKEMVAVRVSSMNESRY
jgi:alkylhydroperoxidase family enzyme